MNQYQYLVTLPMHSKRQVFVAKTHQESVLREISSAGQAAGVPGRTHCSTQLLQPGAGTEEFSPSSRLLSSPRVIWLLSCRFPSCLVLCNSLPFRLVIESFYVILYPSRITYDVLWLQRSYSRPSGCMSFTEFLLLYIVIRNFTFRSRRSSPSL